MSEGKIKIKLKNLFFSHVGTLSVMSEDSLTIEYNERALIKKEMAAIEKGGVSPKNHFGSTSFYA